MTKEEIIEIIHKTIYQFFDVYGDNEEVPLSDKDKLLLSVNKAICNNIKALEQEPCEDAVSRQSVKDGMIKYGFLSPDMTVTEFVEDMLPPVTPTQRWIPCSERLPKIHNRAERYFVTLKCGDIDIAKFTECNGEHWWNFNYDDVVAWQPLPKPYKETENKDGN